MRTFHCINILLFLLCEYSLLCAETLDENKHQDKNYVPAPPATIRVAKKVNDELEWSFLDRPDPDALSPEIIKQLSIPVDYKGIAEKLYKKWNLSHRDFEKILMKYIDDGINSQNFDRKRIRAIKSLEMLGGIGDDYALKYLKNKYKSLDSNNYMFDIFACTILKIDPNPIEFFENNKEIIFYRDLIDRANAEKAKSNMKLFYAIYRFLQDEMKKASVKDYNLLYMDKFLQENSKKYKNSEWRKDFLKRMNDSLNQESKEIYVMDREYLHDEIKSLKVIE